MYPNIGKYIVSAFKDSNYNFTMDSHKDIIKRLKFIRRINEGEKVNVRYMYTQPDGFITKFSRTFVYVDNRNNTRNFVENTITRSIEIIELLKNSDKSSDKEKCQHILRDLDRCRVGIVNLQKTYIDDEGFQSEMEAILDEIERKINELGKQIPYTIENTEYYSPVTPPLRPIVHPPDDLPMLNNNNPFGEGES